MEGKMANISRNEARKQKHLRIRQTIHGTASKPRLNVFKSLNNFEAQLINDDTNKTIAHFSTLSLKIKKGGNIKAATLVGEAMGDQINKLKIETIVFDRGGYIYHGRVAAFADAVRAKGVKF